MDPYCGLRQFAKKSMYWLIGFIINLRICCTFHAMKDYEIAFFYYGSAIVCSTIYLLSYGAIIFLGKEWRR